MEIVFWASLFIVFYTFLGYGIILYLLVRLKRAIYGKKQAPVVNDQNLPQCTLIIAAYNEEGVIRNKIDNTLKLKYPRERLTIIFVTDGSSDRTPEIIMEYPQLILLHSAQRQGKIAAVHRAMEQVISEVAIFTDANTFLNEDALILICRHYADPRVGAVAGEKRIISNTLADASTAGEGFYWKYESTLKKWDSELYSVVGAAGELFSVKRSLYHPVPQDAVLDDFMISMLVARDGYRIIYEPEAYAQETASQDVTEELKRKIRIAAGGMQSIIWLAPLLNIFKYGILSFQYISHRVLRWTITPFLIVFLLPLNILLIMHKQDAVYGTIMTLQLLFYLFAFLGFLLERKELRVKTFFIPYYFCVMNYAVAAGLLRYFKGTQSAVWEKARRRSV